MIETPLWNHLAPMYQYYEGGWAFEDGECPYHDPHCADDGEPIYCACPGRWSGAWMTLCDALGDWDSHRGTFGMMAKHMRELFGD